MLTHAVDTAPKDDMTNDVILTLNAGSSTVKFGVFSLEKNRPRRVGKGFVDLHQYPLTFHLTEGPALINVALAAELNEHLDEVIDEVFERLSHHFNVLHVAAVGHRVVHGGDVFAGPVQLDARVMKSIEDLVPLAPLHQPQTLRLIRAVNTLYPDVFQTGSFDTSFHATNDELVRRFALPRALHDRGIKRYGFHGLSYSFVSRELQRLAPEIANKKIIVAHLGSGCSLCGLDGGVSRDTSMGFSTLDGVPMATRCGTLDPGVLLHLLAQEHRTTVELQDLLYHQSGLLGVSGISSDSRNLFASSRTEAKEALDLFTFRIAGEAARIANTLGGLDAFVFTAGIGEHQPDMRAAVASHLGWLGLIIDPLANIASSQTISTSSSKIIVLVIPTDEEQIIADDAAALLQAARA